MFSNSVLSASQFLTLGITSYLATIFFKWTMMRHRYSGGNQDLRLFPPIIRIGKMVQLLALHPPLQFRHSRCLPPLDLRHPSQPWKSRWFGFAFCEISRRCSDFDRTPLLHFCRFLDCSRRWTKRPRGGCLRYHERSVWPHHASRVSIRASDDFEQFGCWGDRAGMHGLGSDGGLVCVVG